MDWSAATGVAGNIIGGLITNAGNKREAERNRSFQERMSSTSHQREVEDLKKAGLNPLLSATGGASTPSGAQATLENFAPSAISSALDAKRLKKDIELSDANINKTKADTVKSAMETKVLSRGLPEAEIKNDLYDVIRPIIKSIKQGAQSSSKGDWKPPTKKTAIPRLR